MPPTPDSAPPASGPALNLKAWRILRQLHASPSDATHVVNAVQVLILTS